MQGRNAPTIWKRSAIWSITWALIVPIAVSALLRVPPAHPEPLYLVPAHARPGSDQDPGVTLTIAIRSSHAAAAVETVSDPAGRPRRPVTDTAARTLLPDMKYRVFWINLAVTLLGYLAGWVAVMRDVRGRSENRVLHGGTFFANLPAWLLSAAAAAGLLLVGVDLANDTATVWIVIFGPLWVMGCDLVQSALYVALRRNGIRSALDREWLARLNASKLRPILCWTLLAAASLPLPRFVFGGGVWHKLAGFAVFLAGPLVAMIGRSAETAFASLVKPATNKQTAAKDGAAPSIAERAAATSLGAWLRPLFLPGLSVLFMAALIMLVSEGCDALVRLLLHTWLGVGGPADYERLSVGLAQVGMAIALPLLAALIAAVVGHWVKVNRFSLHAVYANRLIRAFLGSARRADHRHADAYTDFDPHDNVRVADSFSQPGRRYLFPVFNIALNMTSGRDSARAERKAELFTVTPRHCGSAALRDRSGAYVPTRFYAGGRERETGFTDEMNGISMGTAMSLSGAAVSPNMGYHSSMLAAFVMTLFNVRLGAWLPNPAMRHPSPDGMARSSPPNGLLPMIRELFGQSNTDGAYVYLSDGGHVDNLGLYEMLRRRCRRILVIDAVQDGGYGYEDLGRVLQHAFIDLKTEVAFDPKLNVGEKPDGYRGLYGEIRYPALAASHPAGTTLPSFTGQILYVKACLGAGDVRAELTIFRQQHPEFPHTPTRDQFFTESDFESYRALGEHLVGTMIDTRMGARTTCAGGLGRLFGGAPAGWSALRRRRWRCR